ADTALSLAVRPDGKQLAIGRFDGVLQLIDADTGKVLAEPLPVKPKPPTVSKLTPNFGARGQTVRVTIDGTGLGEDASVLAGDGLAAKWVTPANAARREADITIAATAAVGPIPVRIKSASGESAAVNFIVDRYAVVTDTTGIDSARKGRLVTLPVTLAGTLD